MAVSVTLARKNKAWNHQHCCIVPVPEDAVPHSAPVPTDYQHLMQEAMANGTFNARADEALFYPLPLRDRKNNQDSLLFLGVGKLDRINNETLRRAAGKAAAIFSGNRIAAISLNLSAVPNANAHAAAFIEGLVLAQYDFDVYKERPKDEPAPVRVDAVQIVVDDNVDIPGLEEELRITLQTAQAVNGARHLGNTPPNDLTPAGLAEFARGIAADGACACTILEQTQMASLGMNALLGVSRGSSQPPALIILEYHHSDDAQTLAIVGKGVTFDTGGISIKPAAAMHEMKFDMCGAAAVLCAMMNIVALKPRVNVICAVPAVENKTGSDAQVPGDIVRAYNGKTIEVLNTDAEGRLILADAMSFVVDKYKPDYMVDLATLTGACVVALGHYAAGIFGNDDALVEQLRVCGEESGDRVWPLPLWDEYARLIRGTHADISNIGPPGQAGAITAAAFLKEFVGDTPWAHLDIAGTAWGGKNISYLNPDHATGFGVRLLTRWIMSFGK